MTFLSIASRGRRPTGLRLLAISAVVVAVSTLGLVAVSAPAAQAASESGSEVTVKWRGGNDPELQKYQVDHEKLLSDGNGNDAGTGHWDDFKDLEVTVSRTEDLRDEAVVVTTTGTAPTSLLYGVDSGLIEKNYLQMFQCWGPDPSDAAFAETCQFGAWDASATTSKTTYEAMYKQLGPSGAQGRGHMGTSDVPFQASTKVKSSYEVVSVEGADLTIDGTGAFFDASTSNEQPVALVDAEGRSRTVFTVQTAVRQPYLGCGNRELAGMRCWLVIVPRGAHSGATPGQPASDCATALEGGVPAGQVTGKQGGSPLTPACNFFQNRVVVPLDFAEPTSGCSSGAPETRILGSELLAEAMSSWQRGLCAAGGSAYNLTTNSGDLTRAQLLTGQANLAVVANPLRPGNIGTADEALLSDARLAYAPVANAALTVSFVATDIDPMRNPLVARVYRDLKITPRLLAKVLTQSYKKDSPNTGVMDDAFLPGNAQNMAGSERLVADPEWAALGNPTMNAANEGGTFVVSGPQGEDVVELLWRYIQADADAVAFLRGEPDPWGNTVNPYYLPSTNEVAVGGGLPYDLAVQAIDTFPRADQRAVPSKEVAEEKHRGLQVDSLTLLPFSTSLLDTAARIARADTKYTIDWDPNKIVSQGVTGQWVAKLPQIGALKYVAGVTDFASASRYAVDGMQLAIPLPQNTTKESVGAARTFVAPTEASLTAAVSAMNVDEESGIAVPDFASLPDGAYPLTAPLYAVADITSLDLDETKREQLATFIDYSAGPGNVVGFQTGQLPKGYAPLTRAQVAQSAAAAELIRNPPLDDEPAGDAETSDETDASPAGGAGVTSATGSEVSGSGATTATSVASTTPTATEATSAGALGSQAVLGGALVAGIVGLGASPFLLRRRGVGA